MLRRGPIKYWICAFFLFYTFIQRYSCYDVSPIIPDKNLIITAGGEQRILTQDDVLKKQEDAKKAKLSAPRGGAGFRR